MSTLAIVIIVVAAIALIALLAMTVLSPRRRAERRLNAERSRAAEHHRIEAEEGRTRAAVAEQRAEEARLEADRVAQDARMERERADLHESRAELHDQGLADDELEHSLRDRGDRSREPAASDRDQRTPTPAPTGEPVAERTDPATEQQGRFRREEQRQDGAVSQPPPRT